MNEVDCCCWRELNRQNSSDCLVTHKATKTKKTKKTSQRNSRWPRFFVSYSERENIFRDLTRWTHRRLGVVDYRDKLGKEPSVFTRLCLTNIFSTRGQFIYSWLEHLWNVDRLESFYFLQKCHSLFFTPLTFYFQTNSWNCDWVILKGSNGISGSRLVGCVSPLALAGWPPPHRLPISRVSSSFLQSSHH